MEAKELQIGDWVSLRNKSYKISALSSLCVVLQGGLLIDCNDIGPIPLTAEILEKNGFRYDSFNEVYRWMTDAGCERHPTFHIFQKNCRGERYGDFYVYSIPMKFVHELQHALRLCGLTETADNFKVWED